MLLILSGKKGFEVALVNNTAEKSLFFPPNHWYQHSTPTSERDRDNSKIGWQSSVRMTRNSSHSLISEILNPMIIYVNSGAANMSGKCITTGAFMVFLKWRTCSGYECHHEAIFMNISSRFDRTFLPARRLHRVTNMTSSFQIISIEGFIKHWLMWLAIQKVLSLDSIHASITPFISTA